MIENATIEHMPGNSHALMPGELQRRWPMPGGALASRDSAVFAVHCSISAAGTEGEPSE